MVPLDVGTFSLLVCLPQLTFGAPSRRIISEDDDRAYDHIPVVERDGRAAVNRALNAITVQQRCIAWVDRA
jgi:hypothetical protein